MKRSTRRTDPRRGLTARVCRRLFSAENPKKRKRDDEDSERGIVHVSKRRRVSSPEDEERQRELFSRNYEQCVVLFKALNII